MANRSRRVACLQRGLAAAVVFLLAGRGLAQGIVDVYADTAPPFDAYATLFPNWVQAPAATFLIEECPNTSCVACATSTIMGVTILNYGTASGGAAGDITGMYVKIECGAAASAVFPMTYAGVWNISGPNYPAWTWNGTYTFGTDPCTGCFCYPSLQVYTDIGPCPTDGATVELGPGFNAVLNPANPGGVYDNCGFQGPSTVTQAASKTIRYVTKVCSPNVAAPGDTMTYTIYYGRPGTLPLTNEWITDSLPAYTHYLSGSGAPAPDPTWDPDPGPPMRLRWTVNGPVAPAGGATGSVTFQATVDWGNGEGFEPGSGDIAAPEGAALLNQAHLSWTPDSGAGACASGRVSNLVGSTVRRYLVWCIGDNDILYASSYGTPDDEMVYSIFVKNVSPSKTWWNVNIWDTVPPELDVWAPSFGFDDPCTGWTMTPSGCAQASPGRVLSGANTIMTWALDLPPGATLSVRWNAHVRPSVTAGSTAINILSLLELGKTGIAGGTGHQGVPKNFVHLAPIVLRTTYISYAGIGGSGIGKLGVFITFYPLNKATDFELYGIESGAAAPWTTNAGLSASISTLIGNCTGGFGCTAGYPGGTAGCKTERVPADYSCWTGGTPAGAPYGTTPPCGGSISPGNPCSTVPAPPYHYIYKIVGNSPILWQLFTCDGNDAHTFTPSSSLNFSGFIHYAFSRVYNPDYFNVMNTSIGPTNTLDTTLATTVHMFTWDFNTMSWIYQNSFELDPESQVMPCPLPLCNAHYRFVSSQAKLVIREGENTLFSSESNWDSFSPARNGGNLTMNTPGDAMYIFPNMKPGYQDQQCVITNMGATTASYKIEVYIPRDTINHPACVPPWMGDTSGSWYYRVAGTVGPLLALPAGAAPPYDSHIYGTLYDASFTFNDPPSGTGGIYRLTLLSGGPIEINQGAREYSTFGGGSLMHPSFPVGKQVGSEFWLTTPWSWTIGSDCAAPFTGMYSIDVFCPKNGMVAHANDSFGYSATYTTNGPDQDVAFERFTDVAQTTNARRDIHISITGGNAIAMYNDCQPSHKFFTAPFVQVGVHYTLILPPAVYVGQSFWITVLVEDVGGGTKTDYCGTTSFTSTDPGAKIAGGAMDAFNFTWNSSTACSGGTNENGVAVFINVSFTQLGLQNIVASDVADGSVTGLGITMVVGADVKLTKSPRLSVAASGDTVQFQICWSNYSSTTAFTFVMTDAVPMGTTFVPEAGTASLVCSQASGVAVDVAYSTSTSATPPAGLVTGNPIAGTRWLRWTVRHVNVNTTGCACFRVSVN